MKYLNKDMDVVGLLAYHRATSDVVWQILGFRRDSDRNVDIKAMSIPDEDCGYRIGDLTWCNVYNLYLAENQFTSNHRAKLLLEEEY
jgi:hypothetical protein